MPLPSVEDRAWARSTTAAPSHEARPTLTYRAKRNQVATSKGQVLTVSTRCLRNQVRQPRLCAAFEGGVAVTSDGPRRVRERGGAWFPEDGG